MKRVVYDLSSLSDMTSMEDFYQRVGISDELGKIRCVNQIHMHPADTEQLKQLMLANSKNNPFLKGWSAKYRERSVMFDWTDMSPRDDADVPQGELHIHYEEE